MANGVFEAFGQQVRSSIQNFAEAASAGIITDILPIVSSAILIFFLVRAWQISSGRVEGSIPSLVESCVKITLVSMFALNAAMFAQYVIPAVYGVESMLLSAVSKAVQPGSSIDSAWAACDETWKNFMLGFTAIQGVWEKTGVGMFGQNIAIIFFLVALMLIMFVVCVYFMIFAVGYLLLYEIFIVMGLAFGPVFIACLMFQSTRTWFDGWLRAMICWTFTLAAIASTLLLINGIFSDNVMDLTTAAAQAQGGKNFSALFIKLAIFTVVVFSIATVVKSIPSFAAGLTGGVALQAASMAGMFSGIGHTAAAFVGGSMLGYGAARGNEEIRERAKNILGGSGLNQTGAFAASSLGYTLGAGMNFFAGKDAAADSGSHTPSGGSMAQSPAEAQTAAQNAMRVGANYASGSSSISPGYSSSPAASAPAGSSPSGSAAPITSNASTAQSSGTTTFGGQSSASSVQSVSQSQSIPDSEFGWDRSQFDSRAGFGSPADSVNLNHQSSSTSESASAAETAAKEEAVAAENQRKADEILKRNKK